MSLKSCKKINFQLYLAYQTGFMKHTALTLFTASLVLLFASCSKEYTCSCTAGTNTEKSFDVKLEKMRKNDAKVVCNDYTRYLDTVSNTVYTCGLK